MCPLFGKLQMEAVCRTLSYYLVHIILMLGEAQYLLDMPQL